MNPLVLKYMAWRVLSLLLILLAGFLFNGALPIPRKVIPAKTYKASREVLYDDTVRITVSAGWNIISVPLTVPDGRASVLFPQATSSAFSYKNGYQPKDTLEFGKGYWLKFPAAETVAVVGSADSIPATEVNVRWNMIGTSSMRIPASAIALYANGLVSSKFFGYTGASGYQAADTLEPGKGYWIKCNGAGELLLSSGGSPGPALLSPANGSLDQPTTIVLHWGMLPIVTSYHLQVAPDSSFTQSMVLDDSLCADTRRKFCLGYGTTCYWRVEANYTEGLHSTWSPAWRFTTAVPADSLKWESLGNPGQTGVTCMAVHPENDSVIYVGVSSSFSEGQQGMILKTTNLGTNWDTLLAGVTPMWIRINPRNPDIVFAGLQWVYNTPPGIIKTTDGGATWSWSYSGIPVTWETYMTDMQFDPQHPDTMFTSIGSINGPEGIFKTTDGGENWYRPTTNDTLAWSIGCIVIRPDTTSIIYANTTEVGYLFRSSDGGYSWVQVGLASETTNVFAVTLDPTEPQIMYATVTPNWGMMKKSTDGGWTWFNSNQGLSETGTKLFVRNCTREPFLMSWLNVYESPDLGSTWPRIWTAPSGNIIEAAALSTDGLYLFIALSNFGIFRARLISGISN